MVSSNLLSLIFLLGFVSSVTTFMLLNPFGGGYGMNQNYELIQYPYRQTQYVVRSQPAAQNKVITQPATKINKVVPQYTNTRPAYIQNKQRTNYGQLNRGLFSGNNLGWMLALGNKRALVTSMLGTSPFMGYYRGQMVKSSPISPGGGMFVGADGTDGTIINADGSITDVDGSDVTRESGF